MPVDRLCDALFGSYLIRRWEEAVEGHDAQGAMPPDLRNHDGDPLLLTVDHFEVTPGAKAAVDTAIAGLDGAARDRTDSDSTTWTFLRPTTRRNPKANRLSSAVPC